MSGTEIRWSKAQLLMRSNTHIAHQVHDPDARDQSHVDFSEQSAFLGTCILAGIGPWSIFEVRSLLFLGVRLTGHIDVLLFREKLK